MGEKIKARADGGAPTRATDGGSFGRDRLNPHLHFITDPDERQAGNNQEHEEDCPLSYDRRQRRYEEEKYLLRFRALSPAEYDEAIQELAEAWQI